MKEPSDDEERAAKPERKWSEQHIERQCAGDRYACDRDDVRTCRRVQRWPERAVSDDGYEHRRERAGALAAGWRDDDRDCAADQLEG